MRNCLTLPLVAATALGTTILPLPARAAASETSLQKIEANGVQLKYVDQGKGVPVIFVHGALDDYRAWQPQMEAFSQRHRTISYSRRYNYPNPRLDLGTAYSANVDADDLAALITKLKLAPAHIVAVSHGACVALFLALKHPELVRSLVLSEPPLLAWLPTIEGGKTLFTDFMSKVWEPAIRDFPQGDEAGVKAAVDGFGEIGYSGSEEKMTFATLPPEVRTQLLENAREWRALTMSKDAFPDFPAAAAKRITAPTLLLSGQRSLALHGLIDSQLASLLPHVERIILPDATHEMWNERPAECREAALAFFAKH
jgi:pimeloyl-ACP methyl ester carboxylesterase